MPKRSDTQHLAIVLDRSGSMESCRDATIDGFNEYVGSIRRQIEREERRAAVTLVSFNHQIRRHFVEAPIGRLHRLSRRTYVPSGSTALLDAVGETLRLLGDSSADSYLVGIITDGYENASVRYSYERIAGEIARRRELGNWTFTYLGANVDLEAVSERLAIPRGNAAAYVASPAGTVAAWSRHARATLEHLSSPAPGDFYGSDADEAP
jgi:hypothetical protein